MPHIGWNGLLMQKPTKIAEAISKDDLVSHHTHSMTSSNATRQIIRALRADSLLLGHLYPRHHHCMRVMGAAFIFMLLLLLSIVVQMHQVYFVHSFRVVPSDDVAPWALTLTTYGENFVR